jgi:hypothetical protein
MGDIGPKNGCNHLACKHRQDGMHGMCDRERNASDRWPECWEWGKFGQHKRRRTNPSDREDMEIGGDECGETYKCAGTQLNGLDSNHWGGGSAAKGIGGGTHH